MNERWWRGFDEDVQRAHLGNCCAFPAVLSQIVIDFMHQTHQWLLIAQNKHIHRFSLVEYRMDLPPVCLTLDHPLGFRPHVWIDKQQFNVLPALHSRMVMQWDLTDQSEGKVQQLGPVHDEGLEPIDGDGLFVTSSSRRITEFSPEGGSWCDLSSTCPPQGHRFEDDERRSLAHHNGALHYFVGRVHTCVDTRSGDTITFDPLPAWFVSAFAFESLNNHLYVICAKYSRTWVGKFVPSLRTWVKFPDLLSHHRGGCHAVANECIYVLGSVDEFGKYNTAVHMFDPRCKTWKRAPFIIPFAADRACAVAL